jgi:mannose-6-phosphate isomerase-like protein (cupin superfamily)
MARPDHEIAPFTDNILPAVHDDVAPDGSLVRLLASLPQGGMAHFELAAGETSRPEKHLTVSEIWFVMKGLGRMWRRQNGAEPREIDLRPGVCLTIPVGTAFQFRNTGREALGAIGVTMPPWPGKTSHPEICQAAVVWMSARRCCQAVSSL